MDACVAAGLVDVWAVHRGSIEEIAPPRIDFVLASPEFARKSLGARWIADPEALKSSDHPAVVADFDWPVEGGR